jgi:SlyX protein
MSESRIVELEIRLAYQDDLLQSLNRTVAEQQMEISKLNYTCLQLHEKLQGIQAALPERGPADEKPPHY